MANSKSLTPFVIHVHIAATTKPVASTKFAIARIMAESITLCTALIIYPKLLCASNQQSSFRRVIDPFLGK